MIEVQACVPPFRNLSRIENRMQTVQQSVRKPSPDNRPKTVRENRSASRPYTYRGGMFIKS